MADEDNITIRCSDGAKEILHRLKSDGVINEMIDGYRIAIALAHVRGRIATEGIRMNTFVNVGSLDKDGSLRNLIAELYPEHAARPYFIIERLAEAGIVELGRLYDTGQLRFGELYQSLLTPQETH